MAVITLSKSPRAEAARPCRVEDLERWLSRWPPRELAELTPCKCGGCEMTVRLRLGSRGAYDHRVFLIAVRSGKSNREALLELRDTLLQLLEVRELLSDISISRQSIIAGVNRRTASAAWWATFGGFGSRPDKPQCGVSKALESGTRESVYA
jgi:hypothetical protein